MTVDKTFLIRSIQKKKEMIVVFCAYTNMPFVTCDPETFMPDVEVLRSKITPRTRALIINNPNNPTGVVYGEKEIKAVAEVLEEKQKELGTEIFLVSDEPYRELVYGEAEVPYLTKYYKKV